MREVEVAGLVWTWDEWRSLGLDVQSELLSVVYPEPPKFRAARGTLPPVVGEVSAAALD